MRWRKAPEELKERFAKAAGHLACERRVMFGYPALFANGYLIAGLFEDRAFVRLPREQIAALAGGGGAIAHLEPMPGRPMKDYAVLPEPVSADLSALRGALEKALAHALSLPPRAKPVRKNARR